MAKLAYSRNGDYYIPDLTLTEHPDKPSGRYRRMRKLYLKENRPALYSKPDSERKVIPEFIGNRRNIDWE